SNANAMPFSRTVSGAGALFVAALLASTAVVSTGARATETSLSTPQPLPITLNAIPEAAPYTPIRIVPTVSLEGGIPDNVNVTSTGKVVDSISTLGVNLDVTGRTRRLTLRASGTLDYQKFLSETQFDNSGIQLRSFGQAELVKRTLFVDAH